ncbi:phosphotransferase [Oceanobacillus halophilus]|uniref:Aminoglycoside phosphotransferase domain-containing protein n=1 Tax=Oceanobacillus halophilus TaxID=930130 RepID=A0A495A1Y7_9BACI|nr:phosphotransferase [Oceanobacillus halophilus]RKQ33482.1 hypothetical protein D8M06_09740 [Oceanobacillus halophilus]
MSESTGYKYVLFDKKMYINIEQSIITLFFTLYSKTKSFGIFEGRTRFKLLNLLPIFVIRAIRVLKFTCNFYKVRKGHKERRNLQFVTTEHYGHFLLKLRQGELKVFDLKKRVVTTVFPSYISKIEVNERIDIVRRATRCKLTPRLIEWNVIERYIKEIYVNARRPSYKFTNLATFYSEVFPILEEILSTLRPKKTILSSYVKNKIVNLELLIENSKINQENAADMKAIKDFLAYIQESINTYYQEEKIYLVFSHGDLWEGNILLGRSQSYVIDWNTVGVRSFYFDFYYTMFMLASKRKHFNEVDINGIAKLTQVLDTSCSLFYDELKENYTYEYDIKTLSGQYDLYRYLFFLELVSLKFEGTNDNRVKQIGEVLTWIKRFKLFESYIEKIPQIKIS